jgi:hypothetical protein
MRAVYSSSASSIDISAEYPVDWCDKRYGMPTRTTGECICKQDCIGPNCKHEQGLTFYSYASCPTCKCVPKVAAAGVSDGAQSRSEADQIAREENASGPSDTDADSEVYEQTRRATVDHSVDAGSSRMYDDSDSNEENTNEDTGVTKAKATTYSRTASRNQNEDEESEDEGQFSLLEMALANWKAIFAVGVSLSLILFIILPLLFLATGNYHTADSADGATADVAGNASISTSTSASDRNEKEKKKRTSSPHKQRASSPQRRRGASGSESTTPDRKGAPRSAEAGTEKPDPVAAAKALVKARQQEAVEARVAKLKLMKSKGE